MTKPPRRPLYHDYQPPELHRAGVALRRGFGTGPAGTDTEAALANLLDGVEQPEPTRLYLRPLTPAERG